MFQPCGHFWDNRVWCWFLAKLYWNVFTSDCKTSESSLSSLSTLVLENVDWWFAPGFSYVLWFLQLGMVFKPAFGHVIRGVLKSFLRWDYGSAETKTSHAILVIRDSKMKCVLRDWKNPGSYNQKFQASDARLCFVSPIALHPVKY